MYTIFSKFGWRCFFQMDKEAIWEESEEDLHQLGLTERGEIIRLKAFCTKTTDSQQKLTELMINAGKSSVFWIGACQQKEEQILCCAYVKRRGYKTALFSKEGLNWGHREWNFHLSQMGPVL